MSEEVAQREVVQMPLTGERLELDTASAEDIGRLLYEIRDLESRLREAKSLMSREVLRRQDKAAQWTTRAGDFVLKGSSPQAAHVEEFDGLALSSDLLDLVEEGLIDLQACHAALEMEVIYKPKRAGIAKLRKLGGRVAEVVNRHSTTSEKTRYVKVERVRS